MSDNLERAVRRAGSRLAEAMSGAQAASGGASFGTVTAVSGAALSVDVGGATLAGLPMTTACSGAAVGDRCLVVPVGTTAVVVGIIST